MQRKVSSAGMLWGKGILRKGQRMLGTVEYAIHVNSTNGQATVVQFDRTPSAHDGDLLHLTLEDGRVLNCQALNGSSYCAVVGDGPVIERRSRVRH